MSGLGLETTLRAARDQGRKLLIPYVTGGLTADWTNVLAAVADAGADAIEIGIPFSDPVMDGPVIQEASQAALDRGTTPASVLDDLREVDAGVPLAVMTYYNLVFRSGLERFAEGMTAAGVSAAILPDLPIEEAGPWRAAAAEAGVETVQLTPPTADDERLGRIIECASGFVYAVGLLGVTGERTALADSATVIARRVKALTDKPVLVGVGVSNAEQAVEVSKTADGVVIGSALVRRLLEGGGPEGAADFIGSVRSALDAG